MLPWLLALLATTLLWASLAALSSTRRRFVLTYAPPWQRPALPLAGDRPTLVAALLQRLQRPALAEAFPDLLAHLATRTAAGASLVAALSDAPQVLPEPLKSQVTRLVAESAITPVPIALERFAARSGLPAAAALAQVLRQHQAHGTPIAQVLTAEDAHITQMQRQQARLAAKNLGALMAVVTVVLLINAMLILLYPFVPPFLDMLRTGHF